MPPLPRCRPASPRTCHRGVTLLELTVAILVMGIILAGVALGVDTAMRQSSNPIIQAQAQGLAVAYLETALATKVNQLASQTAHIPRRLDKSADLTGLEDYQVSLNVTDQTQAGVTGKWITVTVTHPFLDGSLVLSTFRTQ